MNEGINLLHLHAYLDLRFEIENLASCIILLALGIRIRTGMGPSHPTIVTWVQIPVLMTFKEMGSFGPTPQR